MKNLFTKSTCHQSLETITVYLFNKKIETGDLSHLIIKGKPSNKQLNSAWETIYNEYLALFGFPSSIKKYCLAMAKSAGIWEKVYNGEKWRLPLAKIADEEAQKHLITEEPEDNSIAKQIAELSKKFGYRLDYKTMTMVEFHGYLLAE